jgi:hypothetical protein
LTTGEKTDRASSGRRQLPAATRRIPLTGVARPNMHLTRTYVREEPRNYTQQDSLLVSVQCSECERFATTDSFNFLAIPAAAAAVKRSPRIRPPESPPQSIHHHGPRTTSPHDDLARLAELATVLASHHAPDLPRVPHLYSTPPLPGPNPSTPADNTYHHTASLLVYLFGMLFTDSL